MNGDTWIFLALCGALLVFLLMASFLSKSYSLDRIKSKTVGDGQHGTARWATPKEISKTYHTVPFRPRRWRKGKELPTEQGLILGSVGGGKRKSKAGILLKTSRKLLEKLRRPVAGKQKRKPKKKSKMLSKVKKMIDEQGDIRALVDSGTVVITVGGGGIPVVRRSDHLKGAGAVIDKDFASELLAESLDADALIILTAVEKVAINFGKHDQQWLSDLTPELARQYIAEGQFAPGSMLPKVQAALSFAESTPGRVALITLLEKAKDGIEGKTGTRVHL